MTHYPTLDVNNITTFDPEDKKILLDRILASRDEQKELKTQMDELYERQRKLEKAETNIVNTLVGSMQQHKEDLGEVIFYKDKTFQINEQRTENGRGNAYYSIDIKEVKML